MKSPSRPVRPASELCPLALGLALLLCACSPGDQVEISQERLTRNLPTHLRPGASGQARFGGSIGAPSGSMPSGLRANPFRFQLPKGWEELEPTSMRIINLRPAGDPRAECALTILGGSGGGLTANINRWRDQIGLPPATDQQVADLPKGLLLGENATIVDLRGEYTGMGDAGQSDWGLLGFVLTTEQFTVFVKMTGPGDLISAERANFEQFCATLTATGVDQAPDPHATQPATQPGGIVADTSGDFHYDLPDGWKAGPSKSMRVVNLTAGSASECYVIVLGGTGGGLEMNINRWRGEVGLGPVDAAEIESLPKITVLGQAAPLLEVKGDYQGMGGPQGEEQRVLGVAMIRPQGSVFIKMVGPDAEISAERDRFIAFVESLTEH